MSHKYYCQKCGKDMELDISNYEFRGMMLEEPKRLKKLLGGWHFRTEENIIKIYCPDCLDRT